MVLLLSSISWVIRTSKVQLLKILHAQNLVHLQQNRAKTAVLTCALHVRYVISCKQPIGLKQKRTLWQKYPKDWDGKIWIWAQCLQSRKDMEPLPKKQESGYGHNLWSTCWLCCPCTWEGCGFDSHMVPPWIQHYIDQTWLHVFIHVVLLAVHRGLLQ